MRNLREDVLDQVEEILAQKQSLSEEKKEELKEKVKAQIEDLQNDTFKRNEFQSERCCGHLGRLEEEGFTTVHKKRKENLYHAHQMVEMQEDFKGYADRIKNWELGPSKLRFLADAIGRRDFLYYMEKGLVANLT